MVNNAEVGWREHKVVIRLWFLSSAEPQECSSSSLGTAAEPGKGMQTYAHVFLICTSSKQTKWEPKSLQALPFPFSSPAPLIYRGTVTGSWTFAFLGRGKDDGWWFVKILQLGLSAEDLVGTS